jgi:putative flippase GtrA
MIFAVCAVIINLGIQKVVKTVINTWFAKLNAVVVHIGIPLELSYLLYLGAGTLAGFLFKFTVDKMIVFEERDIKRLKNTTRQFVLYMAMAVFTTIIFWTFETSFKVTFPGTDMELIGGLIGLAIGYTVKFVLDSRFVFSRGGMNRK